MELESLIPNIEAVSDYITENMGSLSKADLNELLSDPAKLVSFARQHLYSDILANNLKESIIDEVDFYTSLTD
jgi:hypothetical protein